jgi:hypothetical protein
VRVTWNKIEVGMCARSGLIAGGGRLARDKEAIRSTISNVNEIHASLSQIPPHVTSTPQLFHSLLSVPQLIGDVMCGEIHCLSLSL